MRRSVFTVTLFASAALFGCEDGPNQTFAPAPANAGAILNNGNPDASFDPGAQNFDASYPGKSLQEICGADEKRTQWAKMLDQPIIPPRKYAGLDMGKSDQWEGLKVEEAEQAPPLGNCQSISNGSGGCGSGIGSCGYNFWGDNAEVQFNWNLSTHIVDQMQLGLGYTGKMTFKDRSGANTYVMAIGDVFRKNGQPFLVDFTGKNDDGRDATLTELFNAAMFTFGPGAGIPWPVENDSLNCNTDRQCLVFNDGGDGNTYFGIRPLAIYWQTTPNVPQPVNSTPKSLYNFFVKSEPYGKLPPTLKIDAEGPVASGMVGTGSAAKLCTQKIGLTFGDMLANCVKVTGDPAGDTVNYNKLIGGRQHDFESWSFNVVGVDQNFTKQQGPFEVIKDQDVPSATDIATDWTFDVRSTGQTPNDYKAGKFEARGIALVFIEWARLMLADVAQLTGQPVKKLGDPSCIPPAGGNLPAGCSGIEGLLIPGGKKAAPGQPSTKYTFAPDPLTPPPASVTQTLYASKTSLSPGDPRAVFCNDPGTFSDCTALDTGMFSNAVNHIVRVLGRGNIAAVPSELRDRRYYFKFFGIALVKYLKAYGAFDPTKRDLLPAVGGLGPTQVANTKVDLESLFFDNNLGNLFDKVEYIERDFMTGANDVPWDFEYGTDVKFGNQRYDNWFHRLDREEAAMFSAMATDKAQPPGKENNVNLTNLAGSSVLINAFPDFATAIDPKSGNGMDLNGTKPRLSYYPGVWGRTVFSLGHSGITLLDADKNPNLRAAKVSIPNYADPYSAVVQSKADKTVTVDGGTACPTGEDLTNGACCPTGQINTGGLCDSPRATTPVLQALVPWVEKTPGIGFTIPINGERDKAITTAQLDFTGNLETYIVDFDPWVDVVTPDCKYNACGAGFTCNASKQCVDGTIKIDAIEASDFLGEVFVCQDGNTGDILSVRMYTSALTIVDWFANHPGSQAACDVIIRYSGYNNYIDFITSRANGVKLSINAGQGLGRVVDAVLYDPTFGQQ
jgi:hypothetical protein